MISGTETTSWVLRRLSVPRYFKISLKAMTLNFAESARNSFLKNTIKSLPYTLVVFHFLIYSQILAFECLEGSPVNAGSVQKQFVY